ncbi:hypothetical protein CJF24_10350 [Aeromonas veronii]|uniref:Aminoglycoside phosphotransferase domain-containing protein n=1 Tax=Aeromonas veronii TaxID=654 RepID=A0ABY3MLT6_AERVE|nr:hypothetical protein [Aeromonas veronii]TEY52027.1 hypothetical protein CIG14_09605 [Aeromonas veronii]TEY78261.1 hypothetical protein CIG16_12515 [Aeromonas veronii]TYD44807.1 hypothetical protein CJF24_10350 [Aeromonas veronii]
MNPKVMARQARLLRMLESKEEIRIGRERDCPLPLAQLVKLKDSHPAVVKVYRHGLTAEVFHLKVEGHHWCLKRRRQDSLVANLDGKTAFLTELERRREIEALRELHPTVLSHVVCTSFGSARAGVLVSPWLRGVPVHQLNERNLAQMLEVQGELARWGWFDWDPSPGNLLDEADPLPQFRYWRELCLKWVKREIHHLIREGASAPVLARLHALQGEWSAALVSDEALVANWWRDMYRSHRLDVADDLSGQSCGPLTLRRLDWLMQAVTDHYPLLVDNLSPQETELGQTGLLARLQQLRREAVACQLPATSLA